MKTKFPAEAARAVAEEIREWLKPHCLPEFLEIAGSLRRRKAEVGDIEIVFVPLVAPATVEGELMPQPQDQAALRLETAIGAGWLARRPNALGRDTWGPQIKLALHTASGIPVDFFTATQASWWNYLVCRTGPAESNLAICTAARARGWKWEPYSVGFLNLASSAEQPEYYAVRSERDVFEFVGLTYHEPEHRC